MPAGIFDIITPCNSDFELNIQYTDYNDVAINLTGKKFIFSVKRSYLSIQNDLFGVYSDVSATTEGELEYPNSDNIYGEISVTVATGELTISISKDTLTALTPGTYFYSLKMIGTTTEVILRGKFELEGF